MFFLPWHPDLQIPQHFLRYAGLLASHAQQSELAVHISKHHGISKFDVLPFAR
jgi:hypothetical protein